MIGNKAIFKTILLLILINIGCRQQHILTQNIQHDIKAGPFPWSHLDFDNDIDKFSFAVVSDLFGGERPGVFNVALEQINLLRPELIMCVGDLIDGATEDKVQLTKEWTEFESKESKARAPFFYTGGNHDLTNLVMRDVWKDRYGPRYYHFVYKNVLFLILDSEDYQDDKMMELYKARAIALEIRDGKREGNVATTPYFKMEERRTGEIGAEQSAYFQKVISKNPDVDWTFLFMHKPVWLRKGGGNLDLIEAALGTSKYTVFNGHRHNYQHTLRKDRDYIMLGTTGGGQNDKSDMAFDHFTMITMTGEGPSIANLKLEGVLNKEGLIPAKGDTLCFQASKCLNK